MTSTTLEPASRARPTRLAQGYRWEDEQWKLEPQLPDGAFGSMGGMLTSARDLGLYVGAFLGAWPPRDGRETGPVRRSSLREMQQSAAPAARDGRAMRPMARCSSTAAATGSASAFGQTATSRTSSRTRVDCRVSVR